MIDLTEKTLEELQDIQTTALADIHKLTAELNKWTKTGRIQMLGNFSIPATPTRIAEQRAAIDRLQAVIRATATEIETIIALGIEHALNYTDDDLKAGIDQIDDDTVGDILYNTGTFFNNSDVYSDVRIVVHS